MDILKPQLLWVGKRCYRVNQVANDTDDRQQLQSTTNEYVEEDLYADEESEEQEFEVIQESQNRFKTIFHVPQAYFGAIIGAKGSVKKRIEGETRTDITIPKHGPSEIKIYGTKKDAVCLARRRIELIVLNCRRKQRPTHFGCIRIHDSTIIKNFVQFKTEILQSGPTVGLEEVMFTDPGKLHLTMGVMVLMDDVDRTNAVQLFNDCLESIILPVKNVHKKINISIRGVDIMNDDPSSAQVLIAKIHSEALQQIGDGILKRLIASGLGKREFDRESVKLHMTLVNVKSGVTEDDDEDSKQRIRLKRFDARHILEKYANYEFGSQELSEIHIAIMGSKDADGFYKCTTSIKF